MAIYPHIQQNHTVYALTFKSHLLPSHYFLSYRAIVLSISGIKKAHLK